MHLKSAFHYFSELCQNFELVSVYRTLVYIFHPCNLFRGNTVKEDCPYQRLLIVRQQEQGGVKGYPISLTAAGMELLMGVQESPAVDV